MKAAECLAPVRNLFRSGPTAPVEPASASVWQALQPPLPVNTCLPAAARAGLGAAPPAAGLPAAGAPAAAPVLAAPAAVPVAVAAGAVPAAPALRWEASHVLNWAGVTTRTTARIVAWPSPQSSLQIPS